jgi:hypothetical protein
MTTVQPSTTVQKMDDKMPTLRKIKRAASRHTSQRFCSTFNFTQPHRTVYIVDAFCEELLDKNN